MSPFERHRDKLLATYSTASWLRLVVLAMWNGNAWPVGLSKLTNCDAAHMRAFQELTAHYHEHGENDPAFLRVAEECHALEQQLAEARQRAERFDKWLTEVQGWLRHANRSPDDAENNGWFEERFDEGVKPADAAVAWSRRTQPGTTAVSDQ